MTDINLSKQRLIELINWIELNNKFSDTRWPETEKALHKVYRFVFGDDDEKIQARNRF